MNFQNRYIWCDRQASPRLTKFDDTFEHDYQPIFSHYNTRHWEGVASTYFVVAFRFVIQYERVVHNSFTRVARSTIARPETFPIRFLYRQFEPLIGFAIRPVAYCADTRIVKAHNMRVLSNLCRWG